MKRPRDLDRRIEAALAKIPPRREETVAEVIADFILIQEASESPGEVRTKHGPEYRSLVDEVRAFLKQSGDDPDEPINNFHSKP
jgi:hypothetical protein